jgi:hypothetical protein
MILTNVSAALGLLIPFYATDQVQIDIFQAGFG